MDAPLEEGTDQFDEEREEEDIFGPSGLGDDPATPPIILSMVVMTKKKMVVLVLLERTSVQYNTMSIVSKTDMIVTVMIDLSYHHLWRQ